MKFDVVLADPPWEFRVWSKKGSGRTASSHYPVMTTASLAHLPIQSVAEKNCALFLWAVWPNLPAALYIIQSWGFVYRTVAWVWAKTTTDRKKWHMGMGYYSRANTEIALLAVKGRMPVVHRDVLALIVSPVGQHSAKPDIQYEKIERLYPGRKCLELFACKARSGWSGLGNELDGEDIRDGLKRLEQGL